MKRKLTMKLQTSLLYLGLLISTSIHAQIYVWTDEHGNKVYGDAPQKNDQAQALELEPLTILGFPEAGDINLGPDGSTKPVADSQYTVFSISRPANNASIRSVTGEIQVVFNVQPALSSGHTIQLYLDNTAYGSAASNTAFQLQNIIQGSHSVKGVLLNENGKELKQTSASSFRLLR